MQLLLSFISFLSLVILLLIIVRQKSDFLLYLIFLKPFIDITVNIRIVGNINSLEISAILIFIISGILYLQLKSKQILYNHKTIWMFLILFGVVFFYYIAFEGYSFVIIKTLIKIFEGYFIYFISYRFLIDPASREKLYKFIWISTMLVSIINILFYIVGFYNIDITKGQTRIAGLYNDPGTPSYSIVISLIFATLYMSLLKKKNIVNRVYKNFYLFSWLILALIFYKTLTKSAFLMFLVFVIMWWGVHKKKMKLVIPAILIFGYLIYANIPEFQKRLSTDINVLEQGIEFENIRSLGTGRVNRWAEIYKAYITELGTFEKIFGTSKNYNAHNNYLAFLMQIGMLGLILFFIIIFRFIFVLLRIYRKFKDPEIFTGLLILVMYLIYGITGHPFYYTTLLWYLMIMLGLINVYKYKAYIQKYKISKKS